MPSKAFSTRWRVPRFMPRRQKWRGRGCALKSVLLRQIDDYFGTACQKAGGTLLAIDHHRGSKKTSPAKNISTLIWTMAKAACLRFAVSRQYARRRIGRHGYSRAQPVAIVARLPMAAPAFVFIDGGHSMPAALADWQNWGRGYAGRYSRHS